MENMVASWQPIEELVDMITSLDISGDQFGIIHSDQHSGNFHFVGNQPTIFDFEHCAYGWRAYELVMTESMSDPQKAELFKGYESVRPLSKGEKDYIPVFAKLRELWDFDDSLALDRNPNDY